MSSSSLVEDSSRVTQPSGPALQTGMPPRVLLLNRSFWPDAEATGQLLTELVEDLQSQFDVTVIAGQPNQNPAGAKFRRWGRDRFQQSTVWRLPHLKLAKTTFVGRVANFLSYTFGTACLLPFLRRADLVIAETDPFLLSILGAWTKRWRGSKFIAYLQDLYPDVAVELGKVKEGWLTRFLRQRLTSAYQQADLVVVVSEDMREKIVSRGVQTERVIVLPNWIDCGRVRPMKEDNAFRERYQLQDKFVVMYSGNLGLAQDLDVVIQAAELLKSYPNIEILMVGDGASKARLMRKVQQSGLQNVNFLPYQPKEELAESLSAADLHLVPLHQSVAGSLFPSKAYGIMASGTAMLTICPEDCSLATLVENQRIGMHVNPADPETLAETILWAEQNRGELELMGYRARQLVEAQFDRSVVTARFAQLMNHVLTGTVPSSGSHSSKENAVVAADPLSVPVDNSSEEMIDVPAVR